MGRARDGHPRGAPPLGSCRGRRGDGPSPLRCAESGAAGPLRAVLPTGTGRSSRGNGRPVPPTQGQCGGTSNRPDARRRPCPLLPSSGTLGIPIGESRFTDRHVRRRSCRSTVVAPQRCSVRTRPYGNEQGGSSASSSRPPTASAKGRSGAQAPVSGGEEGDHGPNRCQDNVVRGS